MLDDDFPAPVSSSVASSSSAASTSTSNGNAEAEPRPKRELPKIESVEEAREILDQKPVKLGSRPNQEDLEKLCEEKYGSRIQQIYERISNLRKLRKRAGRQDVKLPKAVADLAAPNLEAKRVLLDKLKTVKSSRDDIRVALDEVDERERRLTEAIARDRQRLQVQKASDLEKKISALEVSLNDGLSSVHEEQQTLAKIRQLRDLRNSVREHEENNAKLFELRKTKKAMRDEYNTIRDELSSIVKEIDSHNEVVNKLKKDWEEKNAQAIEDNSAIEEEIERLEREADSLKEQRREEQAKFRTEVAEFRKRENEFYEALRRKQAAELFMVEHDFKDSLEKKRDVILEDLKRDPNIEKKHLVRTMVSYLQSLLDSNPGEKQGASVSVAGIPEYEAYVPDPSRDADSEDDFVFGSEKPSKAKKLSKQKKKSNTISHSIDKFEAFNLLHVAAPLHVEDVSRALEELHILEKKFDEWVRPSDEDLVEEVERRMDEIKLDFESELEHQRRFILSRGGGASGGRGRGGSRGGGRGGGRGGSDGSRGGRGSSDGPRGGRGGGRGRGRGRGRDAPSSS